MSRNTIIFEFEVNAPASLIYSYLTVKNSLKQWFADEITENKDGSITFQWDKEDHIARIGSHKVNQYIRYNFESKSEEDKNDPKFIEFKIEVNELTQTSFLFITDAYMDESEEDTANAWKSLIESLRSAIGA